MILLPRSDIDVKIVELSSARRDIKPLLELKIAGLYPGSPEETVFDYIMLGKGRSTPNRERAILFIARRDSIEQYRSQVRNASFFLPYTLVRRYLKRSGIQTAVCTFWWTDWHEVLIFDRGELVTSRVFEGRGSPMKLAEELGDVVADEYQQASHIIFCNEQDRTGFTDALSSIRPLPDQILTVERVFRENSRGQDSLFATRTSFLREYGGVVAAAVILITAVILSFFMDRRLQIVDEVQSKLQGQAQQVLEVKNLIQRLDSLTAEYEELAKHRPVDPYLLLQKLSEIFGEEPEVQQLILDETRRIQLDGRSEEPFSLMARLEQSTRFSSLKLSRVTKDAKRDKDRFNLSGVYRDR
jgi:hypothetical protein